MLLCMLLCLCQLLSHCVSAVLEYDIIMPRLPGVIISCAIMIAMSSFVLMHVFVVPMDWGMACILVRIGVVGRFLQSFALL